MPTYQELVNLEASLRDQTVLTAYVSGAATDPRQRDTWRIDLRHSLDDIEKWLRGSTHQELAEFAASRALLEREVERFTAGIGAPGWVCAITADGVQHERLLPVPVPTMAAWSTGPCLAPYVRAIKEARPVVVAIVDHRKVRLFRYVDGRATHVETVVADFRPQPAMRMGRPARLGFHTGTRGATASDEAARDAHEGVERLLTEAVRRMAVIAGGDGWIVIGGNPAVARATFANLGPALAARALITEGLDGHATLAQLTTCARASASTLRGSADLALVAGVIQEAQRDAGYGVVGALDTGKALERAAVRQLYLTMRFLLDHAADAEAAIRLALRHGALVEHVSGEAADCLDGVGGVAARLRYPVTPRQAPRPSPVTEHAIGR